MATAIPALDLPADHDAEKPNHMIFWLDASIGDPAEYKHLKEAFGSNTDPRHEVAVMLNDRDYHNLLRTSEATTVTFEGVRFLLQAFDKESDCLAAFENNQDKRIFFITSGAMGKDAVPKVLEQYRSVFTDKITNEPYQSIYVFCHDISRHMEWAIEHVEYIQMFNFDKDLLQRLTGDIAEYFTERGERIFKDHDIRGALQRLYWAKRLFHQCDKMEQGIATDTLHKVREGESTKKVNELIEEYESKLPPKSSNQESANSDDDAPPSEPSG